jgi:hypothetical protein
MYEGDATHTALFRESMGGSYAIHIYTARYIKVDVSPPLARPAARGRANARRARRSGAGSGFYVIFLDDRFGFPHVR